MRRLLMGRGALALALTAVGAGGGVSLALTGSSGARPYGASTAVLRGTVSRLVGVSRTVGMLDPRRQISVALPLALQRGRALDRFVAGQYTPGSSSYHHFLTPAEFGRRFGAPVTEVRRAAVALRRLGLRVTTPKANQIGRAS